MVLLNGVGECPWEKERGPVLTQLWMKFPLSFLCGHKGAAKTGLAGSRANGAGGLFHSCLSTADSLSEPALLSKLTAEWDREGGHSQDSTLTFTTFT